MGLSAVVAAGSTVEPRYRVMVDGLVADRFCVPCQRGVPVGASPESLSQLLVLDEQVRMYNLEPELFFPSSRREDNVLRFLF